MMSVFVLLLIHFHSLISRAECSVIHLGTDMWSRKPANLTEMHLTPYFLEDYQSRKMAYMAKDRFESPLLKKLVYQQARFQAMQKLAPQIYYIKQLNEDVFDDLPNVIAFMDRVKKDMPSYLPFACYFSHYDPSIRESGWDDTIEQVCYLIDEKYQASQLFQQEYHVVFENFLNILKNKFYMPDTFEFKRFVVDSLNLRHDCFDWSYLAGDLQLWGRMVWLVSSLEALSKEPLMHLVWPSVAIREVALPANYALFWPRGRMPVCPPGQLAFMAYCQADIKQAPFLFITDTYTHIKEINFEDQFVRVKVWSFKENSSGNDVYGLSKRIPVEVLKNHLRHAHAFLLTIGNALKGQCFFVPQRKEDNHPTDGSPAIRMQ